jgi:acyl carrier protein
MDVSEQVVTIIFDAIDEANEVRPKHEWIAKDRATALVGKLDSLGLLNLVLAVESRVNAKFDAALDLSGLLAADPSTSPLRSVSLLADHVEAQLEERA